MKSTTKKSLQEWGWLIALFIFLASLYTYPGVAFLLEGRNDKVMSDGTDAATLPYQYSVVKQNLSDSPGHLLYGALPNKYSDAPEGSPYWMCWIEKILAVMVVPFVPLEQVYIVVLVLMLVLNGLCFYALGRSLGWPKPVCIALGICWAFNPFIRGRAKVHTALTAIYFLPLCFFALQQIARKTDRRSLVAATAAFFVAALAPQYFLLMTAFLAPLFLLYAYVQREGMSLGHLSARLGIAALPAVLFTVFWYTHPVPESYTDRGVVAMPTTGDAKDKTGVHPFLRIFAARPIDYFGGDIAIGGFDLNPLRAVVNSAISADDFGGSNSHERTNGIRWTILILFGAAIYYLLFKPKDDEAFVPKVRRDLWYFIGFAIAGFLLSLPPDFIGGQNLMPSAWLHKLVSQFRVASRAGIFFHFGALMVAGYFLVNWLYEPKVDKPTKGKKSKDSTPVRTETVTVRPQSHKWARRLTLPVVLPLIAIVDFPPLMNAMPVAPVLPAYSALSTSTEETCGVGMHFPYVSHNFALREMYYFLQRMRGAPCYFLNGYQNQQRNAKLLKYFPLHEQLLNAVKQGNPAVASQLIQFVRCVPLDWLVFDPDALPLPWSQGVCRELGWEWHGDAVCKSPKPVGKVKTLPENCLN